MTCPSHTTARDLAEPAGLLALSSSGHYNQSPTLPLPASAYPGTRYHRHTRVGKNSSEPTTTKVLLSARPRHPPGHSEIPGQGTAEQPRVVPKLGGSHQWGRRRPVGGLSARWWHKAQTHKWEIVQSKHLAASVSGVSLPFPGSLCHPILIYHEPLSQKNEADSDALPPTNSAAPQT